MKRTRNKINGIVRPLNRLSLMFALCLSVFFVLGLIGCNGGGSSGGGGGGGGGNGSKQVCADLTVDSSVCDPEAGPFSLVIDNEFFPLVVGTKLVLEGEEDGEPLRVEITVLDETEEVAGVTTRVVEEAEYEDGEIVEVSRNFYAQAPDGTVCYFGEDVDDYEDGEIVSNEGAWRAGEDGNLPGIIMPANPTIGMVFQQEDAPDLAEDQAGVIDLGETIDVPAGIFDDTLTTEDCNPLEDGSTDEKVYVRGIGLVIDEAVELISF